jgi:hypothetical protein
MDKKKDLPAARTAASREQVELARKTLDRWRFAKMSAGDPAPFSSPGVVLKCREIEPTKPGERRYEIVGMMGAKNDAGIVAQSLLKVPRPAGETVFALLAAVPLKSLILVMQKLEPLLVR